VNQDNQDDLLGDVFAEFGVVVKNALDRGLTVHPVKPRDKNPWLKGWPTQASRKPEVIAEWSKRFPNSNYGVVANEDYCILESDDYSALRERVSRTIPSTYRVGARENRPHIYFLQTERSRAAGNMDVAGLFEFKQNNRYVVGEGSIHPTGATYQCTEDAPIVPIPDWLVDDLQVLKAGRSVTKSVAAPLPAEGVKLGEGEGRHPMLMSQAAILWDGDRTREEMFTDLQAINLQKCDPPKTEEHLLDIIDWLMSRPPTATGPRIVSNKPWGITAGKAVAQYEEKTPKPPILVQEAQGDKTEQPVLFESSINQIYAWRGLGKTNLALGLASSFERGGSLLGFRALASRVVYVDGELPEYQLLQRAKSFGLGDGVLLINPEIINPKGAIDLLKPEHFAQLKRAISCHISEGTPGVVILDSQSTLMRGDSLRSDFQEDRMHVLRELRWMGLCVIEMHHSGKNTENQRGSSRNDDILDVQIQLAKSAGWEPGMGLRFDWQFDKVRHFALLESGFTVSLNDGQWSRRISDDQMAVADCLSKGWSLSKIAKELDLNPSKVKRLKAKADKLGLSSLNEKANQKPKET
jgi:hypothetical protein